MKVMIVTPHFAPMVGGVETYTLALAKGLKLQFGYDIVVVTSYRHPIKQEQVYIEGIKVLRLPVFFKISNTPINPFWYFMLRKIIKTEKPNVINTHSPVPFMADMATLAAKNIPVIATYHAGSMIKGTGGMVDSILSFYEKYMLPKILDKATSICAVYPKFVEKVIQNKEKITFMPPGVDMSLFKPRSVPNKNIDLIFVGRIEKTSKWKGLDVLLNALKIVKITFPNIKVQIIGNGDAVNEYRKMSYDLGLDDNISFIENVSGPKIVSYYQNAKMLVLPSTTESESFGIVLIEAMSCGIPVIGTDIGGIPSVINNRYNGLLCEPNNPRSLSDSIAILLNSKRVRDNYGYNGRKLVKEEFSNKKLIISMHQIFESAAPPQELTIFSVAYDANFNRSDAPTIHTFSLASGLRAQGAKVNMLVSSEKEPDITNPSLITVQTQPIRGNVVVKIRNLIINNFLMFHSGREFASKSNVIYERHNIGIISGILLSILYRKPLYYEVNGLPSGEASEIHGNKSRPLNTILKSLAKMELSYAKSVFVQTQELGKLLEDQYSLSNCSVVSNGVNLPPYTKIKHRQSQTLRCIYVGSLDVFHNISDLLDSVKDLGGICDLIVVGDGQKLREYQEKYKTYKNIFFLGRLDNDSALAEIAKADVGLARYDMNAPLFKKYGFYFCPLKLLEYSAYGLPTIILGSSNSFITNYEKQGACFVVKSNNELKIAIRKLSKDTKLYDSMSISARKIAQEYEWTAIARRTIDVLKK